MKFLTGGKSRKLKNSSKKPKDNLQPNLFKNLLVLN